MSFKRLDPEDFLVSSDSIVSTSWSTGTPALTQFYSSSIQIAGLSGDYYLNTYQTSSILLESEVQFSIAYADALGSGSALFNNAVSQNSPTKTVYGQYRTLILEDENSKFYFGKGNNLITASNFWVISLERSRYKQNLFPGSLNLTLSGSGGIINLTDDSLDNPVNQFLGATRVLQLISGSNGTAGTLVNNGYVNFSGSYGLVFPDLGTILIISPVSLLKIPGACHFVGSPSSEYLYPFPFTVMQCKIFGPGMCFKSSNTFANPSTSCPSTGPK